MSVTLSEAEIEEYWKSLAPEKRAVYILNTIVTDGPLTPRLTPDNVLASAKHDAVQVKLCNEAQAWLSDAKSSSPSFPT